jgi:predicted nucleotidyltransferase component of viral defense system
MLSQSELHQLVKKSKMSESVILREYFQLLALQKIYSFAGAKDIFFKGGTCLHLIYATPRFSEDLDFTVESSEEMFLKFIKTPFKELERENNCSIKEKKTIAGKTFLLTAKTDLSAGPIYIKFDFSFREKVLDPQKKIIETAYPVLFNGYLNCFSEEEILAEKIRAVLKRDQGRDYYDLWYLLSRGTSFRADFISEKLSYYGLKWPAAKTELKEKVSLFDLKKFVVDLRPFVPINERDKLADFGAYVKDFILKKI